LEEKQKQPIREKTTTTHWDFQGFLSFFLSFSGAGILSRGLKPVEDWGRRRRRTTALPADFHRV
jgi:hypothetical protein